MSNEMHISGWRSPKLNLNSLIEKRQFEEISKYVNDNKNILLEKWLLYRHLYNEPNKLKPILNFGLSTLTHFKKTFLKEPHDLAIFQLGCLSGHIDCLAEIENEFTLDEQCMNLYMNLKKENEVYSLHFDEVILALYKDKKQRISFEDLQNTLSIDTYELKIILYILLDYRFIESFYYSPYYIINNYGPYDIIDKDIYQLSGLFGYRVAIQLDAKINK